MTDTELVSAVHELYEYSCVGGNLHCHLDDENLELFDEPFKPFLVVSQEQLRLETQIHEAMKAVPLRKREEILNRIYRRESVIFEQKVFNDGKNTIQGRYPVNARLHIESDGDGTIDEAGPTFFATGILNFQTPAGPGQAQFNVEIPGNTVEEAFANFQPAFDAARVKAEADLRQQYLASQAAQAQQLIMPNGQPINRKLS